MLCDADHIGPPSKTYVKALNYRNSTFSLKRIEILWRLKFEKTGMFEFVFSF